MLYPLSADQQTTPSLSVNGISSHTLLGVSTTNQLPSLKLTYPLKMDPWKRRFLLETIIFRGELLVSGRVTWIKSIPGSKSNPTSFYLIVRHQASTDVYKSQCSWVHVPIIPIPYEKWTSSDTYRYLLCTMAQMPLSKTSQRKTSPKISRCETVPLPLSGRQTILESLRHFAIVFGTFNNPAPG